MHLPKNDKTKMAEWETTNALEEFQILCARTFTLIISLVQLLLCQYVYKQHIVLSSFMSQFYFQWLSVVASDSFLYHSLRKYLFFVKCVKKKTLDILRVAQGD